MTYDRLKLVGRTCKRGHPAHDVLMAWLATPHAIAGGGILLSMDEVDRKPSHERALHEISTIAVDGAYASLLAIPVAVGVAGFAFVYLTFLRHRLHRRAERSAEDRARATTDVNDQ